MVDPVHGLDEVVLVGFEDVLDEGLGVAVDQGEPRARSRAMEKTRVLLQC